MTFRPVGLGNSIFKDRYAIHPEETWEEASFRVASHVAGAEEDYQSVWATRFYDEIVAGRFMPGGRVWYGAGKPKAQLLNCFVIPTGDSREQWGKSFYDVTVISGLGGGVGLNAGAIRPRGSYIAGTGGRATGSVSFMEAVNGIGEVIKGGGGRRTALMLSLPANHPDLPEFLDAKLDLKKLNNANISVVLNMDPSDFVRMVHNKEEIPLEFNGTVHGSIRADELWNKIVVNSWRSGEPGVLNGWLANQQNNLWYHKPLVTTNPCGEIWLEEYGCCCLGSLVLPNFVHNGLVDWAELSNTIRLGVRFLDDVLTVNHYPIPEIEKNCREVRRIGLGVMGLHNMILKLGMKYSSPEAVEFIDQLFDFIKCEAYGASIDLAEEKGAFPMYTDQLLESGFAKTLPQPLRNLISRHGLRNCALLTIAPTGTTALLHGCSSGIEPIPAPVFMRQYWANREDAQKELKRELVIDPAFEEFGDLCEGAHDLTPRHHFEIQKTVQKHIDNAVSKTINLPKEITIEELTETWLEYLPYCKGTTLYRFGSRDFQPIDPIPHDQVQEVLAKHGLSSADPLARAALQMELDCPDGVCDVDFAHK